MAVPVAAIVKIVGFDRIMQLLALVLAFLFAIPISILGGLPLLVVLMFAEGSMQQDSGPVCIATLDEDQWKTASDLFAGAQAVGAKDHELDLLFGAALAQTGLRTLANAAVPESQNFPHDNQVAAASTATPAPAEPPPPSASTAPGASPEPSSGAQTTPPLLAAQTADAIGPLGFSASAGWGDVATLMNPRAVPQVFLNGPQSDAPLRGLRELGDEATVAKMPYGAALATIFGDPGQASIFESWRPVAQRVHEQLRDGGSLGDTLQDCSSLQVVAGGGEWAYPLANFDQWAISDSVGPRDIVGASRWHPALDMYNTKAGATCGAPVYSARPGVVSAMFTFNDGSNDVWIQAPDGAEVGFLHMHKWDVLVALGQQVQAGQQIGKVAGEPHWDCHLDFRVRAIKATDPRVKALPILPDGNGIYVHPAAYMGLWGADFSVLKGTGLKLNCQFGC